MHRYILHNDDIREASAKLLAAGQVGLLAGWGVFSTLRVHRGVLFAYERHWQRMQRDAAALRVPFPEDPDFIRSRLHRLIQANNAPEATLRVVVVRNQGGLWEAPGQQPFDLIGLTAELTDWGESVRLAVQPQARHAACPLAGVKMLSWALNLTWLGQAQERGFDEVLLLNERGEVSECTSANIFIARGDRVQTPPLTSGCLPGVTRALLLEEIRVPGITVEEQTLSLEDLAAADEIFITSSTRNLLPVREIEGLTVQRRGRCRGALAEAFQRYLEDYVAERLASENTARSSPAEGAACARYTGQMHAPLAAGPHATRWTRRGFLLATPGLATTAFTAPSVRAATFRCDATPAPGEPLIWTTPLKTVLDPLWAKGVILEQGGRRLILCALDWCGLAGAAFDRLREVLASAAAATPDDVILHTVHQHAAPYVDGDAYRLLGELPDPPLMYTRRGLDQLADKLAAAVRQALAELKPLDAVGTAQVRVERVASSRRVWDQGKLVVRYSTGAKDPYQAALPEGRVDPWLRTITLAARGRPLARLHFYATHPQTFCCDGRASADFVGEAREKLEQEEGVFQLYFTGAAGDVTVGKYNDGSEAARRALAERLLAAMKASAAETHLQPLRSLYWRTLPVRLPPRAPEKKIEPGASGEARYRVACWHATAQRKEPFAVTAVALGPVRILHLPGEPLLEFQEYAQRLDPGRFTAVAGYGDIAPGYICPDRAFQEGGYEPSASWVAPGSEAIFKGAIREALAL